LTSKKRVDFEKDNQKRRIEIKYQKEGFVESENVAGRKKKC